MSLVAVDTNILLYAADNAGDPAKHRVALDLLDRLGATGRGILALQALAEFYSVAVRKYRIPPDRAAVYVDAWGEVFPVHGAVLADVSDAMRVQRDHNVAFWDGMIWSVARRAGARILLSEDLQDGRSLEGVRFANPFEPSNRSLVEEIVGA
ncbi:PIN domain-containing protein [Arenibaculum sp.]|jgi:predicted nucleic acid-binding protein|uniref:PIN domain-containing protein n=1 Tax=Arenibaculum sp. TaxID=2865862 RepID=UPI002E0DBC1E|nr:PIN domain-containing protein [Arenibaculum sp.]